MQVFTEFIKSDLTEDQILPVLRQLLPVLLNILGAPEVGPTVLIDASPNEPVCQHHSALTRARTLSVFRQCVESLYMVKDQYPEAVKEATATVLPVWLDAFKTLLNADPRSDVENTPNWDGLAIRIQVLKVWHLLHYSSQEGLMRSWTRLLILSRHPSPVHSRHTSKTFSPPLFSTCPPFTLPSLPTTCEAHRLCLALVKMNRLN